jgi:uncharacterized protein YaaN involved in tellurite resistance
MSTDASTGPLSTSARTPSAVRAESGGDLQSYTEATPERKERIERALAELDLSDSNSIIFFGAKAQERLTEVSDHMLEGVRNKDIGPAGAALNDMLLTLRGFDIEGLEAGKKPGLLARLFGAGKPVMSFLQRYEEVRRQIDAITDRMDGHKTMLLTDITQLDRLYTSSLEYFHLLADYIAAGEEKLRQLDADIIPAKQTEVDATGDVLKAQELRDMRSQRDDLERRVHDLKLTRQVTMQGLPSIRLVQENDKSLITKINSTIVNTVPLWRTQLAQAVTIYRSREAGQTLKEATDLTNDLLLANAENLKQANAEIRQQVERGAFDIETVKKANDLLIATVEESLQIADEGKRQRAVAEARLEQCETDLRHALSAARSRVVSQPRSAAS